MAVCARAWVRVCKCASACLVWAPFLVAPSSALLRCNLERTLSDRSFTASPLSRVPVVALLRACSAMPDPISPPDQLKILSQVTKGLAYLHYLDMAHRDLKPANVLLSRTLYPCKCVPILSRALWWCGQVGTARLGLPSAPSSLYAIVSSLPCLSHRCTTRTHARTHAARLTDFGLTGSADSKAAELGGAGTIRYAAPEVLSGATGDIASDIYRCVPSPCLGGVAVSCVSAVRPLLWWP